MFDPRYYLNGSLCVSVWFPARRWVLSWIISMWPACPLHTDTPVDPVSCWSHIVAPVQRLSRIHRWSVWSLSSRQSVMHRGHMWVTVLFYISGFVQSSLIFGSQCVLKPGYFVFSPSKTYKAILKDQYLLKCNSYSHEMWWGHRKNCLKQIQMNK